ncbi:MAG TPA: hypothetical protein VIC57_10820 [Candidatus Dormibacteraeota bacterium]|jgi:hypothetical protein
MDTTYIGAWRAGTDGHYLWQGADWNSFQAKWQELSGQGYRLTRITTFGSGGQRRWAGVWRAGSDGHYLWVGADWNGFTAKWSELSGQGLRLVDVKPYVEGGQVLWAAAWRAGTDGHYLWASDWNSFQSKWQELSGQNLRLVAIDTYGSGPARQWVGVWREGSDGHYLWVGADWNGFTAKWKELAAQGLRLFDLTTYVENNTRLFAGVWRAGNDPYELWWGMDLENFLGQWNQASGQNLRLVSLEAIDSPCQGSCCNHVVSRDAQGNPAPYVYYVTGDPNGPYRWPVDANQYARVSALTFAGQPFNLPFNDPQVVHWGTWLYSAPPGNWHHAIDFLRPNDWKTFEARAAAPGKVIFSGWDSWSGNTVIVSHDAGGVTDAFRTIYMHLRNGPTHDIDASWNQTVPTLSGATLTNYESYLNATGAAKDPAQRNPNADYWGTNANAIDPNLVGKTVAAGDHLAWAGCTGPGGCGCTGGAINHPNTHLHVFFCHRDLADNNWYFIDPFGIYSYPAAGYPPGVTDAASGPCVRYSVAWKGGKPQYP